MNFSHLSLSEEATFNPSLQRQKEKDQAWLPLTDWQFTDLWERNISHLHMVPWCLSTPRHWLCPLCVLVTVHTGVKPATPPGGKGVERSVDVSAASSELSFLERATSSTILESEQERRKQVCSPASTCKARTRVIAHAWHRARVIMHTDYAHRSSRTWIIAHMHHRARGSSRTRIIVHADHTCGSSC